MATLYTNQDTNIRKTWFLMTGFFIVVMFLGWAVSWYFNNPIILYFFVIFAVGMNIVSYWTSDKIVLRMSGARRVKREEYFDLWNIVENLSITAGLPMPKVYIIEDPAPNAFATGRDPKHGVVAVTTGLLKILNKTELEGVVGHELSHIGNRDILISTMVVVLVGFVTLLSDFFLRATIWGGGRRNNSDGRAQLFMMIAGIVLAILAPIIASIIQLAVSRKREFLADSSGALLTRYPEGLASALEKISGSHIQMIRANHATAHMYIANPFKDKKKKMSFMNKLFLTHPPTEERIAALRGVE
jgi:heat shock protein HtpX